MNKFIGIFLFGLLSAGSALAQAEYTVYYDRAEWLKAVSTAGITPEIGTETFQDVPLGLYNYGVADEGGLGYTSGYISLVSVSHIGLNHVLHGYGTAEIATSGGRYIRALGFDLFIEANPLAPECLPPANAALNILTRSGQLGGTVRQGGFVGIITAPGYEMFVIDISDNFSSCGNLAVLLDNVSYPGGPDSSVSNPNPPVPCPDGVPPGTHCFTPPTPDVPAWYDPPATEAFDFSSPDAKFISINDFPPGFASPFTVTAGGVVLGSFMPGQSVQFPNGGVNEFRISGISPAVDGGNPYAFPINLTLDQVGVVFTMSPAPTSTPTPDAADLAITNTAPSNPVMTGSNIAYTITVTNNGPTAASSVTVTDTLPASTTFVSCSATGGGVCGGSGNNRTVTFTSLAHGSSATVTLVAIVNCSVAHDTAISNTATVSAVTTDPNSNNNSATANITASNPPPLVTCPANISQPTDPGACSALVSYATPTATDNCAGATVACSPSPGSVFPKGTTTVTCTATDSGGASAMCTFTVTVRDEEPPSLVCPSNVSRATDPGQCAALVSYAPAVSDNSAGASFVCTPPSGATFPIGTSGVSCIATDASGNTAACGFTVTINNQSPAASINSPASVATYPVGTTVSFAGSFTDNVGDVHTAQWSFVSNTQNITQSGSVNETTGAVSASYTFTSGGVYLVSLTVADQCGHTSTANVISPDGLTAMVVIYDPNGGFLTGGGWIDSPAGAYTPDPALTGKASFGFVSRYERGATVPSGNTEFQFRVANFNFHSGVYEWLVVAGARAQYKGSGTVNGAGNYGFMLTAIDGQINGGGGTDKFRIKIWDKNNADAIVYDNQLNTPDSADPSTVLGGGSIVIHR